MLQSLQCILHRRFGRGCERCSQRTPCYRRRRPAGQPRSKRHATSGRIPPALTRSSRRRQFLFARFSPEREARSQQSSYTRLAGAHNDLERAKPHLHLQSAIGRFLSGREHPCLGLAPRRQLDCGKKRAGRCENGKRPHHSVRDEATVPGPELSIVQVVFQLADRIPVSAATRDG